MERVLKSARKKHQVTFKGKPIIVTADFSIGTLKARKAWNDVFQALKENNSQPILLCPANLSIIVKGDPPMVNNN
jgi:hypothetical protein